MYCPSCGVEYSQKLNYCKQCGARLKVPARAGKGREPHLKFTGMFWAIAVFGTISLTLLLGALISLVALGVRGDELLVGFFFGALIVLGIAGMMIRQLSRLITAYQETNRSAVSATASLPEKQPAQIAAAPDLASSVVEDTTRQFDTSKQYQEQ